MGGMERMTGKRKGLRRKGSGRKKERGELGGCNEKG